MMPPKRRPPSPPTATANAVRPVTLTGTDFYDKLGIQCGFQPLPPERARWILLGMKAVGKTSLCKARGKRTLILDMEQSAGNVRYGDADYIAIDSYKKLVVVLDRLKLDADAKRRRWDHICFDTLDVLQDLVIEQLSEEKGQDIREFGTKGAGWNRVATKVGNLVRGVFTWGYGWTCCAHQHWVTVSDGQPERLRPSVTPGVFKALKNDADYICRLRWIMKSVLGPATKGKGALMTQQRVLVMTTETREKSTKDTELARRVALPAEIELPITAMWQPVQDAWEAATQQEET